MFWFKNPKDKKEKTAKDSRFSVRLKESGNVFFTLFGAVALVGVVGVATSTLMRGPLGTVVKLNQNAKAESQMQIAHKLAMLEAAQKTDSGDCDADGFVEPIGPLNTGSPNCAGPVPTGGGCIPDEIGASKDDPWGTNYGYCAWDHGAVTGSGCSTFGNANTDAALNGTTGSDKVAVAIVSAGPDRAFQTQCGADPAYITYSATPNDDIVLDITYAGAVEASGGLWALKSGDPDTAAIDKDIEVGGQARLQSGGDFAGDFGLQNARLEFLGNNSLLLLPDEVASGTCNAANQGALRRNTAGGTQEVVEVCDFNNTGGWVNTATVASGTGAQGNAGDIQFRSSVAGMFDADNLFSYNATSDTMSVPNAAVSGTAAIANIDLSGALFNSAGSVDINDTLDIGGNTSLTGTLTVSGATDVNNSLEADSATLTTGGLTVSGGGIDVNGGNTNLLITDVQGAFSVGAFATTLGGTLTLTGDVDDSNGAVTFSDGDGVDITADLSVGTDANVTNDVYARAFIGNNGAGPNYEGLYFTSSGLYLQTEGSKVFEIDGTGDVGIGLSGNPTAQLDVDGAIRLRSAGYAAGDACGSLHGALSYSSGDQFLVCSSLTNQWETVGTSGGGGGGIGGVWDDNTGYISYETNSFITSNGYDLNYSSALEGAGSRLIWYTSGKALRAGTVTGTQWDEGSMGVDSAAFGLDAEASGTTSFAVGDRTVASAEDAVALGAQAEARAAQSVAIGNEAIVAAGATNSMALGLGNATGAAPQVLSTDALGVFMGDQSGVNFNTANAMLLAGGKLVIDPDTTSAAFIAPDGSLTVDVQGKIGATHFCSETDTFCFTAEDVASGSVGVPGADTEIIFNSGGVLGSDSGFVFLSASNRLGVGTALPAAALHVAGTDAIIIPKGTDAERPSSPQSGMLRFNSTSGMFEGHNGTGWNGFIAGAAGNDREILFNSGGSMSASSTYKLMADGDLLLTGTYTGTASVPATGAGTRMFFDTQKAAFRAGSVAGTEWDNANIGNYSVALGGDTTASNGYAFAAGRGSVASGWNSAAIGNFNIASGTDSIALGRAVTAGNGTVNSGLGDGSMAIGLIDDAVTITTKSQVTGIQSLGIFMGDQDGLVVSANNQMGVFGGKLVIDPAVPATQLSARGVIDVGAATDAVVLPRGTTAQRPAPAATVDGMIRYNSDNGKFEAYQAGAWQDILTSAVAGGAGAPDRGIQFNSGGNFAADAKLTYTSEGDLIVGSNQIDDTGTGSEDSRMYFDVSNSAFRAGSVTGNEWNFASAGQYSAAFGVDTVASGYASVAIGEYTEATGASSVAMGSGNTASSDYSVAMGRNNTASTTSYNVAMGSSSDSTGGASFAMGQDAEARGYASIAMGNAVLASGDSSVAMGDSVLASGHYSMARGAGAIAGGDYSTAFGNQVNISATGDGSAAFGLTTTSPATDPIVSGAQSFALFMGNHSGKNFSAANTMGVFGGKLVIDPAVPATRLAAKGVIDVGAATDAIIIPKGTDAQRPAVPEAGMIRFSSTSSAFEGYNGTAWGSLASGAAVTAAGADREIQFNSGGSLGATSTFKLTADGDLLLTGTYTGTASVPATGAGTRMFFDTQTGALRAGSVSGTQWDNANLGGRSVALGQDTTASGYGSTAVGYSTVASANFSTALGHTNYAQGLASTAFGYLNSASGEYSTALGRSVIAGDTVYGSGAGDGSMAIGLIDDAVTVTTRPRVTGIQSLGVFMGDQDGGVVMNAANTMGVFGGKLVIDPAVPATRLAAKGVIDVGAATDAIIIPKGTDAQRPSVPEAGMMRFSSTSNMFEGYNGSSWSGFLAGAAGNDREIMFNSGGNLAGSSTFKLAADGDLLLTATVTGAASVPASGVGTRMFFDGQKAAFRAGTVTGTAWDNASIGTYSTAVGANTIASGDYSVALGNATVASGTFSTTMGNGTIASGIYSTAIGRVVTAGNGTAGSGLGDGSMAIGLIDDAVTITTKSQVTGIQSLGIFMGDQDGLVVSANNQMGVFGGQLLIDPAVPATRLAAKGVIDVGAATDAIIIPKGTDAQRPAVPEAGMIRFSSTSSAFEGYNGTAWGPLATTSGVALSSITAATATNTIDSLNFAQAWNWSTLSTQSAMTMNANAITSGKMLDLASSSTAFTGTMAGVTLSGNNAANTGTLMKLTVSGASSAAVPLMVTNLGTGLSLRIDDSAPGPDTTPVIVDASGQVAIGAATARALLDVNGDDFIVSGTYSGTASVPASGAGTRMFFDTQKAAVRAGYVSGTQWDNASIGNYSVAMGYATIASGANSTAMGWFTTASGASSTAMGGTTIASGQGSTALGGGTTASGYSSVAMGNQVVAGNETAGSGLGDGSMAIGLIDDAVTIASPSQVTGIQSLGVFMGDQDGLVVSANNQMGVFGGKLLIDPAVPSTRLAAKGVIDVGAATDAIIIPKGTDAQRPAVPEAGMIRFSSTSSTFEGYNGTAWGSLATGATPALSSLSAAAAANTIANTDYAQVWNWTLTTAAKSAMTFGEAAAATNGAGAQSVVKMATLASSTAMPLWIENAGNALSFRVDDAASDTTPFVIDASGNVGIGVSAPGYNLAFDVTGAKTIGIGRSAGAGQAGMDLTVSSGGAVSGGTNLAGGNLVLSGGTATGTGTSKVIFQGAGYGSTGTADRAPAEVGRVSGGGYVQFTGGAVNAGDTMAAGGGSATPGAGTRMVWYPYKAAFRAGYVSGTQWDDANIGYYSIAAGDRTTASLISSTAFGGQTTASGNWSTALGLLTTASANSSTAMGSSTTASGLVSLATGYLTIAAGDYSTAFGRELNISATGDGSAGFGLTTTSPATDPIISGAQSFALFMGNHSGVNFAAASTMGVFGGNLVIDPAVPATQLTARGVIDVGAATDAIVIPRGTAAQRPGTPVDGMIRYKTDATIGFEVREAGAWVAMGAAVSDQRLKTEIKPLDGEEILSRLAQVDTYSYVMKSDESKRIQYGVLAQELQKTFPELVDGMPDDPNNMMSVRYMNFIAPLIEATKELKSENEALKTEITALKADRDSMRVSLEEISRDVAGLKAHTGYGTGKAMIGFGMLGGMAGAGGLIFLFGRRRRSR